LFDAKFTLNLDFIFQNIAIKQNLISSA